MRLNLDGFTEQEIYRYVLEGLERDLARVRVSIQEIQMALGSPRAKTAAPAKTAVKRGGKRRLSEEGRARIAAAQRKRWKKAKAAPVQRSRRRLQLAAPEEQPLPATGTE